MKRIFLFGSQITVGGAQRVLLDQAQWFMDQGYDVQAVFFYDKNGLLPEWSARYPFPITALSSYRRGAGFVKNFSGLLKGFAGLIRMLKQVRPDCFESFTHDANLMGIPAAWLCGIKGRFATHHGQFAGQSALSKRLHTMVINSRMAHKLICVSERAKNQALSEKIRKDKTEVIFNGVRPVEPDPLVRQAVRQELGLGNTDIMILNVGRLVPEKAQQHLVTAASLMAKEHPEVHFFIAGEGPCRPALEKQILETNLTDQFTLLGNRSDVDRLLNAADIFVLYSDTEGMPVSLMEAMSAGLCCAASDLEGIAQLIPDRQYGTLLSPGNPALLAETLTKIIKDPQTRDAQGKAAAVRIRGSFSLDASCRKYEDIFIRQTTK
ncbi:MAG: glycosyltransferase [Anaerolineaceae bacterium]|nr:glycosyltransferase [Anaerolineaceae bacterium]